VTDWPFSCYFLWPYKYQPFVYTYWHNRRELGWGSVGFADGHAAFLRATTNDPDFQRGPDWTFIHSDRR